MFRVILALAAVFGQSLSAQQPSPAPSVPAQPAPAPVPVALPLIQIAARGEDLTRALRENSRTLPSESDLAAFEEQLSEQEKVIRAGLSDATAAIEGGATMAQLRSQTRQWRTYSQPEARQRKRLDDW